MLKFTRSTRRKAVLVAPIPYHEGFGVVMVDDRPVLVEDIGLWDWLYIDPPDVLLTEIITTTLDLLWMDQTALAVLDEKREYLAACVKWYNIHMDVARRENITFPLASDVQAQQASITRAVLSPDREIEIGSPVKFNADVGGVKELLDTSSLRTLAALYLDGTYGVFVHDIFSAGGVAYARVGTNINPHLGLTAAFPLHVLVLDKEQSDDNAV